MPGREPDSTPAPPITVLALVHERTEFIERAIDSALRQSLEPAQFSVLLIANRLAPAQERSFKERGVEVVRSDEPELGAKVAEGLRRATGQVVAFLEDDDRFEPTKLEEVGRRFSADPGLGFYHNHFRLVGDDERPWGGPFYRRAASARIESLIRVERTGGAPPGGWLAFRGLFPGFNNSCISVRRSAMLPWLDRIARSGLVTDECLFLAAAASGTGILQDSTRLTRLMVHPQSVSSPVSMGRGNAMEELFEFSARNDVPRRALEEIAFASRREDLVALVQGEIAVQQLIGLLRSPRSRRRSFPGPLREALHRHDSLAVHNFPGVLPLSTLALLSPAVAHWAYLGGRQIAA
jgi:glycosyltransferase involved in cell wall biosynthesis